MEQRQLLHEQMPDATARLDIPIPQAGQTEAALESEAVIEEAACTESPLALLLQEEARSRRREEGTALSWSVAFLTSMLLLTTRAVTDVSLWKQNMALCFLFMGAFGAGMCLSFYRRSHRRKRAMTSTLAQINDIAQVGPLVQALRVQNTPVRSLTKQTLTRLLPTLRASDSTLLGDVERSLLLRHLAIPPNDLGYRDLTELFSPSAYRRETDFRVAILKALEQVGGEREQATVERLSRGQPTRHSLNPIPKEIQEAARACLPYLQSRASEQRAREQLLRASSVHSLPEQGLLRPVSSRSETEAEQLLRAAELGL